VREVERKLAADVVIEEKVARISDALDSQKRLVDRLVLKGRRPDLGSSSGQAGGPGSGRGALEASEHKAAFETYVRSGEMDGLKRLEAKALTTVTSPDSGYLAPLENPSRRPASRQAGLARPTRGRRPTRRPWSSSNIR
jgi:HK97 family phage major capsid protein